MSVVKEKDKKGKLSWFSLRKDLRKNYKEIILVVVISVISLLLIALKLRALDYALDSKHALLAFGLLFIMTVVVVGILWFARKKRWKIERVFLICGILLGTIYCFVLPVGAVPDEAAHFWRVYEISEGRIFFENDGNIYAPANLKDAIDNYYLGDRGYSEQIKRGSIMPSDDYAPVNGSADTYAFFDYIPQVVGVWIGKIFNIPYIPMMILGRLLNMACCMVIIYFCIKYIPMMKKILFLIAMFPMTMQQFSSVSADGLVICAGIALITYVLYARETMRRYIGWRDFLLLLIICLALVIVKPVYAPLCFILFWIPKERFKNYKIKVAYIFSLGAITLVTLLTNMILNPYGGGRFNATDYQLQFIKSNPLKFLMMVFSSNFTQMLSYSMSVIGHDLEWFSVNLYDIYAMMILVIFILLCAERDGVINRSLRNFAWIALIGVDILIYASMFVTFSTPNQFNIEGVQGRYYLPILLLIPMLCMPVKNNKETVKNSGHKCELVRKSYLYIATTMINVYAIVVIICSHFR